MCKKCGKKMKSPSYKTLLQKWSKEVRERDGNRCVICGATRYLNRSSRRPFSR